MIIKANPIPVQSKGCNGIQEAGGQAAQSSVAKGGFRFHLLNPA